MDDSLVFAFTADGGWLYNAPKAWSTMKLPAAMANKFGDGTIKDIKCATFGTRKDSYFYSYLNQSSTVMFGWGNGCPASFLEYLKDTKTGAITRKNSLKVVLGPNDSYFAWDEDSIRWSKIPEAMEACIQEWLGPAGWTYGPPRLVALGANDSWLAVSEYGAFGYSFPDSWTELHKDWKEFEMEQYIRNEKLLHASLSSTNTDHYVFLTEGGGYIYNVPEPMDKVCEILDSLAPEDVQQARKEAREQAKLKKQKEEAEEAEKAATRRQLALHFANWRSRCETNQRILTTFPHLPIAVCKCKEVSCVTTKNEEDSLKACRHDVEQLLRVSGSYSLEWLRKERLQWHPDKFARQCDPDFRRVLTRKATELYAIFEVLIEAERSSA